MSRADGLRPGQAARASRVATMLANVVRELQHPYHWDRNAVARGVALHLKATTRVRDLDQPNGQDAIGAIVAMQPIKHWEQLARGNGIVLGKLWLWVVQRARQELRGGRAAKRANVRLQREFTSLTSLEPVSIVKR